MQWNPYLLFNGECEAAFRFYERCLGGRITYMTRYGESPMAADAPPEWRGKILHATLTLDGAVLSGADALPQNYRRPQGFYVVLAPDDAAEAERIFQALAEDGVVEVSLAGTFWALRFGMVVDRFGTPWMINCGPAA